MTLSDVIDNPIMVDALLRMADAPSSIDVEKLLSKAGKTRVVVDCSGDSEGRLCKYIRLLLRGYDSVEIVEGSVQKPSLDHEIPPPSISIEGELGGRYRFHGLPEELLAPPFLAAIAAAGGAWKPKKCPKKCGSGGLVLYVVPGVPCAKAMIMLIDALLCCRECSVDIVNVDTLALLGKKIPVNRVPAFRSDSQLRVGLPKDIDELARFFGKVC